jgi:hypothetical protein
MTNRGPQNAHCAFYPSQPANPGKLRKIARYRRWLDNYAQAMLFRKKYGHFPRYNEKYHG